MRSQTERAGKDSSDMSQADVDSCGSSGSILWSVPELGGLRNSRLTQKAAIIPIQAACARRHAQLQRCCFHFSANQSDCSSFLFLCVKRCSYLIHYLSKNSCTPAPRTGTQLGCCRPAITLTGLDGNPNSCQQPAAPSAPASPRLSLSLPM